MKHITKLALLAVVFAGCGTREYVDLEVHTIAFSGQTKLHAHQYNGNVTVAEDGRPDEILIEAVKRVSNRMGTGGGKDRVSDMTIKVDEADGIIDVTAEYPRRGVWRYVVDFTITVPPGLEHDIDIGDGDAILDVSSGRVTVDVGNGNVMADIALLNGGSMYLGVGNGDISLSISPETNASLNAQIGNGVIDASDLVLQNKQSMPKQLTGNLGAGGGTIRLLTGNGNIGIGTRR